MHASAIRAKLAVRCWFASNCYNLPIPKPECALHEQSNKCVLNLSVDLYSLKELAVCVKQLIMRHSSLSSLYANDLSDRLTVFAG